MCDTCSCGEQIQKESLYLPETAVLRKKETMTDVDTFFEFEMEHRSLDHLPGQFVEISIPGIGEAPISISSAPSDNRRFEMVIRNVGSVTNAVHALEPGEKIGIRGPFGSAFPMNLLKGKNLLFITGGIGLVPSRSAIHFALGNRDDYKDIIILFGCRDPSQRLFTDEIKTWTDRPDITFMETVDRRGNGDWKGHTGVITTLIPKLNRVDPLETCAIVVGPPVMYKYVIMSLHDLDFSDRNIIVSLERRMKCGVGKCGHCQMNNIYICQDGPVFYYEEIKHLREAL